MFILFTTNWGILHNGFMIEQNDRKLSISMARHTDG
jgi:hypothetical protein